MFVASYFYSGINKVLFDADDISHKLLLELWRIKPTKLDSVLFNVGPGSFTGLRVNVAIALGLSCKPDLLFYGFDLQKLPAEIGGSVVCRVTKSDFLVLFQDEKFQFLKSDRIDQIDFSSFKFQVYCDDVKLLQKLEKLPNLSILMAELNKLWIPLDISSCTLNYGLNVQFKKVAQT